ncbi:MAG: phospho-N-acetylmuramoyl-pentapeptide-transferase [Armatimonadetes bacterium]|nr:phospho-N-acetylmuramoyl-pentapeptide-transferase [Armatimonadota bacterium]
MDRSIFYSEATILPFALAFAVSMIIAPSVISALKRMKVGQTIQEDGPESHQSKAGTPTMGGFIILAGYLVGIIAPLAWMSKYGYWKSEIDVVIATTCLIFSFAVLGMVDDYLTIRPIKGVRGIASKPKAFLQALIASMYVMWLSSTGMPPRLSILGITILSGTAYWIFSVLFIAGMANFVNITDGLDGLVSGLTIIFCLGALTALGLRSTNLVVSPILAALGGGCLAFLWFNTNPARVFMGDTGSLAIGAALPAISILTHHEVLMMVIGLVFILDGFSTIIQWAVFKYTRIRTGTGRRVFLKSPVHHHFEMAGIPEQTVVVRFWICGIIAAVLGYAGMSLGWW